jgi:tetratricopeptide (TPR) repeat protein
VRYFFAPEPAPATPQSTATPYPAPARVPRAVRPETAPLEDPSAPVEQALTPEPDKERRSSGGELLERANRLRAQGEFARAERVYSQVMRRAGEPDDTYVATVAVAALRLEHRHSPREALALYRRALRMRPEGPLAASARLGIAQCHRALAQSEAEAQALGELIASHPGHLLRSRAEARLRELGAEPSQAPPR